MVYAPQSSVANQLAIFTNMSYKSIVAQAFILELGLGGTTSVGNAVGDQAEHHVDHTAELDRQPALSQHHDASDGRDASVPLDPRRPTFPRG